MRAQDLRMLPGHNKMFVSVTLRGLFKSISALKSILRRFGAFRGKSCWYCEVNHSPSIACSSAQACHLWTGVPEIVNEFHVPHGP